MLESIVNRATSFSNGLYKLLDRKKEFTKEKKAPTLIHIDTELAEAVKEYNKCLRNEANAESLFIDAAVFATSASKAKLDAIIKSKKIKNAQLKQYNINS